MADNDNLFEEDPADEGEEDLDPPDLKSVERTAVWGADWTAETIVTQLRRGNIDLSPGFQRRDVWRDDRKSAFIESLFLGLPIPQLVLAETKDRRGGFLVIDGKQRLTALSRFATDTAHPEGPLRLKGLLVRDDLNGMTLEEIESHPDLAGDVAFFQNATIRTVVLRNWPDDDLLYRVFQRLNTGSVPLSPQELRQALIPGPFVRFVAERSGASLPIRRALNLADADFRMRDAELLVRYYGFANFLPQYRGNLKAFLDDTCRQLNGLWEKQSDRIEGDADACDTAIETAFAIFGENAFRRWTLEGYEGRFNRAVFDIMTFYFRRPSVAKAATGKKEAVIEAYKTLSETDPSFVEALQSTTKTISATHTRLAAWGEGLATATGRKLPVPELADDNRIRLPG